MKIKRSYFTKAKIVATLLIVSIVLQAVSMTSFASENTDSLINTPIAAGSKHNLIIRKDGTVWGWGYNRYNQLGLGRTTSRSVPTACQTVEIDKVIGVSAGKLHSICLKEDKTVWAWGNNAAGQVGQGSPTLTKPYSIIKPVQVTNLKDVIEISAGDEYNLALKQDGSVWSWGNNIMGNLGDGTNATRYAPLKIETLSDIVHISAGNWHNLAVKADGTLWSWGYNEKGQLGNGGSGGMFGVFNTGIDQNAPVQVLYIEDNTKDELPQPFTDVKTASAGLNFSLALKNDGTVWAWGRNDQGQLGIGDWNDSDLPKQVMDLNNIVMISAGQNFSLALRNDGTVWTWGRGQYGQLGQFTEVTGPKKENGEPANGYTFIDGYHHPLDSNKPIQIKGLSDVSYIAAGDDHGMALDKKGMLWTWGFNDEGQIGNGAVANRGYPLNNVKASIAGGPFTNLDNILQPNISWPSTKVVP